MRPEWCETHSEMATAVVPDHLIHEDCNQVEITRRVLRYTGEGSVDWDTADSGCETCDGNGRYGCPQHGHGMNCSCRRYDLSRLDAVELVNPPEKKFFCGTSCGHCDEYQNTVDNLAALREAAEEQGVKVI